MQTVTAVSYKPLSQTLRLVHMPITPRQADMLYPLKGIKCFDTYAEAEFWLICNKKSRDALILASIAEEGGCCLLGHRYI